MLAGATVPPPLLSDAGRERRGRGVGRRHLTATVPDSRHNKTHRRDTVGRRHQSGGRFNRGAKFDALTS